MSKISENMDILLRSSERSHAVPVKCDTCEAMCTAHGLGARVACSQQHSAQQL